MGRRLSRIRGRDHRLRRRAALAGRGLTVLGLAGTLASVLGNEAAIRLGRRRLIEAALACLGHLSLLAIRCVGTSYWLAVALLLVYGPIVWLDSSSLTAGAAGTAEPAQRGATLAVHSMLGYRAASSGR